MKKEVVKNKDYKEKPDFNTVSLAACMNSTTAV